MESILFIQSLIWSAICEIENKSERKRKIFNKIFDLLISENYNISNTVRDVSESSEKQIDLYYEKYKLCYLNCLSSDYYLQNGRYDREFIEKSRLGEGGYGVVYEVSSKVDNRNYALKKVRILENINKDLNNTLNEIKIWESLRNEFIVQYKTSWIEDVEYKYPHHYSEDDTMIRPEYSHCFKLTKNNTLFIQMELCDTTLEDLFQELNIEINQTERSGLNAIGFHIAFNIFLEIIEGINYLHTQKPPLIHRDIKLSNILIKQHSNNSKFIKISDFGLTTHHSRNSMTHTSGKGTPEYIAPEVMNGREYNEKSDIYSIGVLMSKMFLLTPERTTDILNSINGDCIKNTIDTIYYITQRDLDKTVFESGIKHKFRRVMKLLSDSPEDRPNASDILNKSVNYCTSIEYVKKSKRITELYYRWLKYGSIGSKLLNQLMLKHLSVKKMSSSDNGNENIVRFNSVYETKNCEIFSQISGKSLFNFNSFEELEKFMDKYGLTCILLQTENKYIKRLIKLFAKHRIEFNLLYENESNFIFILMNNLNYFYIKFICGKSNEVLFIRIKHYIQNNEHLENVISKLDTCEHLDNTKLFDKILLEYKTNPDMERVIENQKFVFISFAFIYISTKDNRFFVIEKFNKILTEIPILNNTEIIDIVDHRYNEESEDPDNCDNLIARILTDTGIVYSFETNYYKNAAKNNYFKPILINKSKNLVFVKVCVGLQCSIALTIYGEVYVWGDKYYGREDCGCSVQNLSFDVNKEHIIDYLIDSCDYHTKKQYFNEENLVPIPLNALNSAIILDISSGNNHSMALTKNGDIYCWGYNIYGQLGIDGTDIITNPRLVDRQVFANKSIIKVVCNRSDSFALTYDGDIYACGVSCDSSRFIKINDDLNKFVDIFAQNQSNLLVAKSTNEYCFMFGYHTNIAKLPSLETPPPLLQSPMKCVHNCFFYVASIELAKTYKPLLANDSQNEKSFSNYQLIQLLKENVKYKSNLDFGFEDIHSHAIKVLTDALNICVSFHGIKLYVENSCDYRCYVMESSVLFIDEFIVFMNENQFQYLLAHEQSYQIVAIVIDRKTSDIQDNRLLQMNNRLDIKSIDSFPLNFVKDVKI